MLAAHTFLPFLVVIVLNLVGFLLGFYRQTDKFTDLTYSLSFIAFVVSMLLVKSDPHLMHILMAVAVLVWALRLGVYLFIRIHNIERDLRFDQMRPHFFSFLGFWVLQTLTVLIVSLPIWIFISKPEITFHFLYWAGLLIWCFGFILESIADYQKFIFKKHPANKNKFMRSGIWRRIRHPNYLGEILVWSGIFISVIPYLQGWQWIACISPIWIFILLRYVSGIPLLEKQAQKKYGDDPEYKAYITQSRRLLPKI